MTTSFWSDDRVSELRRLWDLGFRTSEIARLLGGGCTIGMVSGKVDRLGLAPRRPPAQACRRQRVGEHNDSAIHRGADGLHPGGCRFPLWADDARPDFSYCGSPVVEPSASYCAEHHALMWVRLPRSTPKGGRP